MSSFIWVLFAGCGLTSFIVPAELQPVDLASVPTVETTEQCVSLGSGERIGAISPEGHAWLVTEGEGNPQFRIIDPFGDGTSVTRTLELPPIQQMRAWSDDDATFVAGGTVWRLPDGGPRVRLSEPPISIDERIPWCGELETNGILVSDGQWVEQQDDAWYLWEPTGDAPLAQLLDRDGQCQGADGITWGLSDDGLLWRVDADRAEFFEGFAGWVDGAAADEDLGILLTGGTLWVGAPERWTGYALQGPESLERVEGGGDTLYVAGSSSVLRVRDGAFARLAVDPKRPVVDVVAHAHGVWVVEEGQLCHHADGPAIRVDGLRPNQATRDELYTFTAEVVSPELGKETGWSLAVSANGAVVPLVETPEGGWSASGAFPTDPTTRFTLEATRGESTVTRTLSVHKLRLPGERSWAVDVKPIFDRHCAGCHGVDGISTDLTTLEAWQDRLANIEARVVDLQDMPPQDPNFGEPERTVIEEWLERPLP
ncbi:MAG: cytochrome c [Myxococcota bacterium]